MRILIILCLALIISFPAAAQRDESPLAIDIASDHIDITTAFSGSRVVLYGTKAEGSQTAVVIRGPARRMIVREKEPVGGLWMNVEQIVFENVPSYYDYATSLPEDRLSSFDVLRERRIGLNALDFSPSTTAEDETIRSFQEAMIRNKQNEGMFPLQPSEVQYLTDTFFKVEFDIPPRLPTGIYIIEVFLFEDGVMTDNRSQELFVEQVGLNGQLVFLSEFYGFYYGFLAVTIALIAGWGAFAVRRL